MNTVIITNCTNRKRLGNLQPVELATAHHKSLAAMTAVWIQQVKASVPTLPAASLYTGRSVQDAKRAAEQISAKLMFASTGLGLVSSDHPCPAYNLTVAEEPNSIRPKLADIGAAPSDWWDAVNDHYQRPSPIAALARRPEVKQILVALSSNYIDLVSNDLGRIRPADLVKLRIFTSRPGVERLPAHLKHLAMPYDERLEGSHLAGTRADFPQRALRHFVESVMHPGDSPALARQTVSKAMAELQPVAKVNRRRASDEEVLSLLANAWSDHNGSSSRLLRYLRDEALVSCEQSRFRGLWLELRKRAEYRS